MSKSAFVDFKKLKDEVGIHRILDRYGLLANLKEQGDRLSGRCPICEGESESFRVSQERNCYKCFRCDAGGNILDFVAAKEECSIREAAVKIAEWFDIQTGKPAASKAGKGKPTERKVAPPTAERPASKSPEVRETVPSKENGHAGPPAMNVPLTFELKLERDHPWFNEVGLLPATVKEFGLGFCSKGVIGGRIAFPIHDPVGQLIGYAGRWPGEIPPEGQPVWKYPKNLDLRLIVYPVHKLVGSHPLAVRWVRDPLAVVLGWQAGHCNLLAVFTDEVNLAALKVLIEAAG